MEYKQKEKHSCEVRVPDNDQWKGFLATFKSKVSSIVKSFKFTASFNSHYWVLFCVLVTRAFTVHFLPWRMSFSFWAWWYANMPNFTCSYLFLPKVTVLTLVRAWNAHLCRNHQPLCVRLLTAFLFLNFWVSGPNYKNTSYTDFIVPWFEKCEILSMTHTWSDTCILQLSNNLNFNLKMLLLSPHFFHINFKKWKWSPTSEQQAQLQSLQEPL